MSVDRAETMKCPHDCFLQRFGADLSDSSAIFSGMALGDLTANAVNAAIDEYEQMGGEAFRAKYGFGAARDYFVIRDGHA
jgi:hypothetical protein